MLEDLALTSCGYSVEVRRTTGPRAEIILRHPLSPVISFIIATNTEEPGWASTLRQAVAPPDIEVARRSSTIRLASVAVIHALRKGAAVGTTRRPTSDEGVEGALQAISSAALTLQAAGVLNSDEVDWLADAVKCDQEWL